MNLFILSLCFQDCARYMFDKHISKIILEACQMLCTAKRLLDTGFDDSVFPLYKIAHKNHPVTIWMRQSYENYMWTIGLIEAMHDEWKFRYDHPSTKQHKSFMVAMWLKENPPSKEQFSQVGLTPFAMAMPDMYKGEDPVESYRQYYQSPEKRKLASWKKRETPDWFKGVRD